jgi:hypothetical protein
MKLDMQPLNKRVFTTKGLKAVLVIIFTLSFGFGQITIVASGASGNEVNIGETYSQNFNGLIASGSGTYTDNSTIAGWYVNSEEMDSNADEYIEQLAREKYRMAKPGEKVFKVLPKNADE